MGMGAVGKAAVLGEMEDFLEIGRKFFGLHIKRAEALDAGSIDEVRGER